MCRSETLEEELRWRAFLVISSSGCFNGTDPSGGTYASIYLQNHHHVPDIRQFDIWSIIRIVQVLWEAIQSELVSDECSADLSMGVGRSHGKWFHVISRISRWFKWISLISRVFPADWDLMEPCWHRKCLKTSQEKRHLLRSFTAEMKSIFEEVATSVSISPTCLYMWIQTYLHICVYWMYIYIYI